MKTNNELIKKGFTEIEPQDRKYFLEDYHTARKVMCSASSTLEDVTTAFENLTQSYLRCNITEGDKSMFVALLEEHRMRTQIKLKYLLGEYKNNPRPERKEGE